MQDAARPQGPGTLPTMSPVVIALVLVVAAAAVTSLLVRAWNEAE